MPFGEFKDFADCVRKVSRRKNPPDDPKAYCAWLKRKIEGNNPVFLQMLTDYELIYRFYLTETGVAKGNQILKLLNKEDAKKILDSPSDIRELDDATLIDDHRWLHLWEKTLERKHHLFISRAELRKLHQIFADEMVRRGMGGGKHRSPMKIGALQLSSPISPIVKARQPILLDPEFISIVGSSILKSDPNDIDLLFKCTRNKKYKTALLETVPKELRDKMDFVWERGGPSGLYVPAYQLWAIPTETMDLKEPKFDITPMSPILPASPTIVLEDPRDLIAGSYYIEPYAGIRAMIHRKENLLMAFDRDLEELDIPDIISKELLQISDPSIFILDGFIVREEGELIFRMIDLIWWRESQHTKQDAETRKHFLNKMPESDHIKFSKTKYFANRKDAIEYLKGESSPYLLIPGMTSYPNDGKAPWLFYDPKETWNLAEAADAKIKELVDSGKWEDMSADTRFNLMTKRKAVEPLYPFAQMKTTKKGYSVKEVFGIKSVKDLADELFKVPSKQAIEVKIDGFRAQIHRLDDEVRIFTESGHEITKQIPGVVESAKKIPAKSFVLDSEATPYSEDLTNLGRTGAVPAFAKGAKKPVDDSLWALHVFDMLYIDGEDIHNLPYEERRNRLRGIELPIRDTPKSKENFRVKLWENTVSWATSAEQMIKEAERASKVSGSEGAMFKQSDSKYRLSGNTPLWSKMKSSFEIDSLVVGVNKKGKTYNYIGAIGPVQGVKADAVTPLDSAKGVKFVKWKGDVYSVLGKSFNTKIVAEVGDIIRVSVKNIRKIDDNVYHWFHPQVLEAREDKTKPDPIETAQTIYETSQKQQKTATTAFLVNGRFGNESQIGYSLSPWIALQRQEPLTDEERAINHFFNGDRTKWEKLSEKEKKEYIKKLPPRGQRLEWDYTVNNEDIFTKLSEIGIEKIVGTGLERKLVTHLGDLEFEFTKANTIGEYWSGPILEYMESVPRNNTIINPVQLRTFYEDVKDMPREMMQLSCGGAVPLNKLKLQKNLFLTYPDENKEWKYVTQFHVRGLSVHADFRCQVSKSQLIGWTWNLGKSLTKPMLRRVSQKIREEAGITAEDLKKTNKELSEKLNSTAEGRKLRKTLSKKVEELDLSLVKKMLDELWKEDAEPKLADPNKKILTQIKHPMSVSWLDYEDAIPAGAVGATSELGGRLVIMDKGRCQFGAQKSYFHEYFLNGERVKNRRMIIRRIATRPGWEIKQTFAWMTFFSKPEEVPYTLSSRAVTRGWMPPKGISAIPQAVRTQIPKNRQYWRAKNAKEIRNELVKDIKKKDVTLKLAAGLQFSIKRVWHKGPEVKRGLPVTRYWLLLHSGGKVLDAWDFGKDNDPLEGGHQLTRRRDVKGLNDLLPVNGEIPADHPASWTKRLPNSFDTSDTGQAKIIKDADNQLHLKLNGRKLKGTYVFVRESGEMWTFGPASVSEQNMAILMQASDCNLVCERTGVLHLAAADVEVNQVGDLLFLKGPAIKPGEVLPMDGKPAYFTREGIKKFWSSMHRQPIVVLHGDLKGDVIGFVNKSWFDGKTGWGWVEGVIWHPKGIQLILEKKLPAFSIEVVPETIWDPEHQHDHIIGGKCVGLAVVPKGACVTCTPTEASMGEIRIERGKVYKFGQTTEEYITDLYWRRGLSTAEIGKIVNKHRTTIESWMKSADIPRRDLQEARHLRGFKEETIRKFGGRVILTALGTGAYTDIPRDDCPQCTEAKKGGKSARNFTASLFSVGTDHLLINAPPRISGMLGTKKLKPDYVLIEHIHDDVISGLHELRPLKPSVFATAEVWSWLRKHYRSVSKQKGDFDDIYGFPRYVIKPGQRFALGGAYTVTPYKIGHAKKGDPSALGFKIDLGGEKVWHSSDVLNIPDHKKVLGDVDIYIGDGSSLTRDIGTSDYGHASMEKQIKWAQDADVGKIYFTQIGHVRLTYKDLNTELQKMAPNAQALYDGAELQFSPGNPGARFTAFEAEKIANGKRSIIVRAKPYQEYAKQAIYLLGEDRIHALYVEGFPEGPFSAKTVKKKMAKEHGMADEEWTERLGDAKKVWIYRPRVLKRYDEPKEFKVPDLVVGPYIHHVKGG